MKNLKDYVITVIGDSISKGVYLDNGKIEKVNNSAIDIIQKELDCNIVNESSFGQTLERAYNKKLFAQYLESLDKSKKNILVLSLGGNDSDYDWKQVSQQPTLPHSSKTDADTFYHTLTEIITQAKASGVEVIVTSLSPIDSERYFVNVLSNNYNADNI